MYEGTSQLSSYCYVLLDTAGETLGDNHDTKQHHLLHSACLPHQQTSGLPSCMHQIGTENFWWLQDDLLVEGQDNEKEATRCCYNNHCSIDEQFPRPETLECTSAGSRRKFEGENIITNPHRFKEK